MQSTFTQSLQKNFFFDSSDSKLHFTNYLPNSQSHNRDGIHSLDKNNVKIYKTSFFSEDLNRDFKREESSFPFMSNYREINYWIDSGRPPCTFGLDNKVKFPDRSGDWSPEMFLEPSITRTPQYHEPIHKPLLTDDAVQTNKNDLFTSSCQCPANQLPVKKNNNICGVADTERKGGQNFQDLNGKCKNKNLVQISKESQSSSSKSKQTRKRNKKKVNLRSIAIGPDPESTSSGSDTIMLTLSKVKSKRIHQKFLKKILDNDTRKSKVKRNIFLEKATVNNCVSQDRVPASRSNLKEGVYHIGRKDKGDAILKKSNLDDDSEVSVLTANYIRSTKRNTPIKKGRRQCILQLIKDSDDIDDYCNNRRNRMATNNSSRKCHNNLFYKNGDVKKSLRPIVVCHKLNEDLLNAGLVCYSCCNNAGNLLSDIKVNSSHQHQIIPSGSSSEIFDNTLKFPRTGDESSTDNLTKYKKVHIDSIECKPGSIELRSNVDRSEYDSSDERTHKLPHLNELMSKTSNVNRITKQSMKDRSVHRQDSLALRHSKIKRKNTNGEILNRNVKGTRKTVKQYKQMLCIITDPDSSVKSEGKYFK